MPNPARRLREALEPLPSQSRRPIGYPDVDPAQEHPIRAGGRIDHHQAGAPIPDPDEHEMASIRSPTRILIRLTINPLTEHDPDNVPSCQGRAYVPSLQGRVRSVASGDLLRG